MLDERGAALDPVAAVAIENPAEIANLGVVNMAADDAVDPAAARFIGHHLAKRDNVLHGVLDPMLQKGGQGPVGIAEPPAHCVEVSIYPQRNRVGAIAEQC